jgi:hypothetical protein
MNQPTQLLHKPAKIANRDARQYVQTKRPFAASNLYSEWKKLGDRYVYIVYSYGPHWPLFLYDNEVGVWFENMDHYSRTTSKHRSQSHPHVPTIACSAHTIKQAKHIGVNAVLLRGEDAA